MIALNINQLTISKSLIFPKKNRLTFHNKPLLIPFHFKVHSQLKMSNALSSFFVFLRIQQLTHLE